MAQEKIMNFEMQKYYDSKIKAHIKSADDATLASAKEYADGLASNYDAAGTAQTKVDALANGAVKTNADNISALQTSLNEEIARAKAAEGVNAEAAATAKAAADKAQGEVDAVELDMGDVDTLSTTNKTVVGAINEVLAAVGTGGTAAVVTISSDVTSDGMLKSYTIKQGDTTVGVIDIPKDMVVESGEVITNPEGQPEGTYIKLVLANVAEPLYVNVGSLVDIYKAKANATQIQIAIDSASREISATVVAGSITSAELADNSVVTAKIADANVTKAKLSTAVQASLDKADASASKAEFDEEVARAKAAEEKALTDAKAYTDEKNTAMNTRMEAVEAMLGDGEDSVAEQIEAAKQSAISTASADATSKANTAESNAKAYTDAEIVKVNSTISTNKSACDAVAERVTALEDKVGDGFVAITESDIDSLFV